jgi:4-amino-4-deoxy-L-arabinose transferase-like glycosyltransferase
MKASPGFRRYFAVAVVALACRVGFILWQNTGACFAEHGPFSPLFLSQGYAIAAGYGYIEALDIQSPVGQYLKHLPERVDQEGLRLTPQSAAPLPEGAVAPHTLHPPGTPLVIAGIHRLLGIGADIPMQLIGTILDVAAAVVVCWLATRAVGERVGLLCGLLYALFPPLVYGAMSEEPDGWLCSFVVFGTACIWVAAHRSDRTAWRWFAASGLLLGLGSYLRPDYLLMPVFMAPVLWLYTRKALRSLGGMAVAQVIAFAVLLPWAFRNHTECGRWIFTSSSVGPTLITGLGEFQNPWGFGYTDGDRAREAKAQGFSGPFTSGADLYFRGVFWRSVKEHPWAYVKSVLRRAPLCLATPFEWGFVNPWKTSTFADDRAQGKDRFEVARSNPRRLIGAYWDKLLMGGITLLGSISAIWFLVKGTSSWRLALLLLAPHVYAIASHMLTHIEPRYLLPSIFCWLLALSALLVRVGCKRSAVPQ